MAASLCRRIFRTFLHPDPDLDLLGEDDLARLAAAYYDTGMLYGRHFGGKADRAGVASSR